MSDFTPQKRPTPVDISLIEATVEGYSFIKTHFYQLGKWAIIPVLINFFNYLLIDRFMPQASVFSTFAYSLPGMFAFGWYVFAQTRLQVFGEEITRLPDNDDFYYERRQDLIASVCFYALFQMVIALVSYAVSGEFSQPESQEEISAGQLVAAFAGMTIMLWLLKYGVLHLVAAVSAPLRDYTARIRGFWFSFTLLGAGFASTLPILLVFLFIITLMSPAADTSNAGDRVGLYLFSVIMNGTLIAVLNATLVAVLRQLYGGKIEK